MYHRMHARLLAAACLLALASWAWAQVTGVISEVVVSRGQALVTREIPLEAVAGSQELVVTQLPERIIPDSLSAAGDENLIIRAVRYRAVAVSEEPREEVRKLDAQIQERQRALKRIASNLGVLDSRARYLDKLETFSSGKVSEDLGKGTLNPSALIATTDYIFKQRDEIAVKRFDLENEKTTVEEALSTLQRERNQLMAGRSRTRHEAVVTLEAQQAKRSRLTLSYAVTGVDWTPAYSARLSASRDTLNLEYQAVVNQTSGEDWPQVRLTLSTTRPAMQANSPSLSPLWVSVTAADKMPTSVTSSVGFLEQRQQLNAQLRGPQAEATPGKAVDATRLSYPDQAWADRNVLAGALQSVELAARDEEVRASRTAQRAEAEGLAVTYALPGKVSLQSRADQQLFRIAAVNLPADFYYTAVPLLSDYVFQAVDAVNTSDIPLLPGPYHAYLDGNFAGRGALPLIARGQSLTIGFGTETQLRVGRELADKSTTVRGGNQVVVYQYELRLQNYMDRPATIRLWDRIPQAPDNMVSVTLAKVEPALSVEEFYQSQERPRGLLRWDVTAPAQAIGAKATPVRYQLQLEFDKNYRVGEVPPNLADRMLKEFETLNILRYNR